MKHRISVLAVLMMLLCLSACAAPAADSKVEPAEAFPTKEIVTYYCTIGNYTQTLLDQIESWNETEGADKGVEIQVTTLCNCPLSLEDHLKQGDRWDLIDGGDDWALCVGGWITDLASVEHPQIQALLTDCRDMLLPGVCRFDAVTAAVPKEAVPIKLAVNLDLFEKNGLELPETWEDAVAAAKVITDHGAGVEYGWGASTWGRYFSTFILKGSMGSVETGFWDSQTGRYGFAQFETQIKALAQMHRDGSLLGLDSMGLDEIREQFARGKIGMLPAIGTDASVYTWQFPAKCSYTFIDMPAFDNSGHPYSDVFDVRCGPSICAPSYDQSSDAHRKAIEEAWLFLNGAQLNRALSQSGCIIPCRPEWTVLPEDAAASWRAMSDLENRTVCFAEPDSWLEITGETYTAVFTEIILGHAEWCAERIADLEDRYNRAYQEAIRENVIPDTLFVSSQSH